MIANLTVPALKTLISDMNLRSQNGDIIVPSKARKADIITLITEEIDRLHSEALTIDATPQVVAETDSGLLMYPVRPVASLMERAGILSRKVRSYFRQNGAIKLTPAQWRRVSKAMAKHGVTYADMNGFLANPN